MPTNALIRLDSSLSRAALSLALLGLVSAACAGRAPKRWSLAESRCAAAQGMIYSGDLETIFGRLHRTLAAATPAVHEDLLLRTLRTQWQPVPHEEESRQAGYADRTTFTMRFKVELKGEGPYRVMLSSETRAHTQRTWLATDAVVKVGTVPARTLTRYEDELRARICDSLAEFAAHCDGSMLRAGCDERPFGSPSDYRVPHDLPAGISVSEPVPCEPASAYIRVERQQGARRLGVAREHGDSGGFAEGCMELGQARGPGDCPSINVVAVLHEAGRRLRRRGVTTLGTGAGPCAPGGGDYSTWNMSVAVRDWRYAAEAVQVLADLMEEYDLSGYAGIAVRPMACAELVEEAG